ncbi:MAG: hypothetical protein NTZ09_17615 [Candidatus Hydrogenedentes bacterium]|nr:hypothetical protein [Candidatus Hydrogenedentota bacterium]
MTPDGVMTDESIETAEETVEAVKASVSCFMGRLPATETRVAEQTFPDVNEQIARQIEANVYYYARHPEEIEHRLNELEREWDIERALETTFSAVTLGGFFLGMFARRFRILAGMAGGFMLEHALHGWSPPLPLFRRIGIRSSREINLERYALKALRGDFENVDMDADPAKRADRAVVAASIDLSRELNG